MLNKSKIIYTTADFFICELDCRHFYHLVLQIVNECNDITDDDLRLSQVALLEYFFTQ